MADGGGRGDRYRGRRGVGRVITVEVGTPGRQIRGSSSSSEHEP